MYCYVSCREYQVHDPIRPLTSPSQDLFRPHHPSGFFTLPLSVYQQLQGIAVLFLSPNILIECPYLPLPLGRALSHYIFYAIGALPSFHFVSNLALSWFLSSFLGTKRIGLFASRIISQAHGAKSGFLQFEGSKFKR